MHFAIATAQVYIASPKAIGNSIVNELLPIVLTNKFATWHAFDFASSQNQLYELSLNNGIIAIQPPEHKNKYIGIL